MSTCRDAHWPHMDCPDRANCDWQGNGMTLTEWEHRHSTARAKVDTRAPWPFKRAH